MEIITRSIAALALMTMPLAAHAQERAVDSLMQAYAAPGMPGASVLVVRDGRVALARSYGLADVEARTPVRPATNFRLASLTKQFTATVVMLLVADGRLHYGDPAGALIDGLPSYARNVTIKQLLNHTAGLPDYEDFVPDSQTRQVHDAEIPALIAHAPNAYFEPGTQYRYSNTGYVLLALAAERVTGRRFADLLHDMIFAPLGMASTVAFEEGRSTVPDRAYGYTVRDGTVRRTDQSNTSATLGDGGVYTSIADLAKWDAALERHTLVSADAQQLAWTPPPLPNNAATQYGFGWFATRDGGVLRLTHNGESRGFTNGVVRFPDKRIAVWVLTNRTGGAPWQLAQKIAELYGAPATAAWSPR